jgi:hypothetical protein
MITSTCGIGFGNPKSNLTLPALDVHEHDLFGLGHPTPCEKIKHNIHWVATQNSKSPMSIGLGFTVVVTLSASLQMLSGERIEKGRVDERGRLDFSSEPSSDLHRPLTSEMRRENGHFSTSLVSMTMAWPGMVFH